MEIEITTDRVNVDEELRSFIDERVHHAFDRFEDRVRQVRFRLRDVNGPKGGVDQECNVMLILHPRGELIVEEKGETVHATVSSAIDRASHALARHLDKLRDKHH